MTDKKNMNVDTENKEINDNSDFSVGNIFEDFESNNELEKEVKNIEKNIKKDSLYYVKVLTKILKVINIFIITILIILFVYIKLQETLGEREFLDSVCYLFLGRNVNYLDLPNTNNCKGIFAAEKDLKDDLEKEKRIIHNKLANIAVDYYIMKNFINSEEVLFILNASKNKKNPLKMLEDFDKVKNKFLTKDKLKIQCKNLKIKYNELEADCNAYSSFWDESIPGYNGEKSQNGLKGGTSVSIASSFLNFLEKQGFILIDKQKVFKVQDIINGNGYSLKTPFKIHLLKKDLKLK